MMTNAQTLLIGQLEQIDSEWKALRRRSQHNDVSDLPGEEIVRLLTRARAAIERASPPHSAYVKQAEFILALKGYSGNHLTGLMGVIQSLLSDIQSGYLQTVAELIHGELFRDFLEMASHLADSGYKDAAAVIVGSALEAHLRQLCHKAGLSTDVTTGGDVRPKKADQMNSELSGASVYSKLDQKSITAWLDLRNKAAHGKFSEYTKDQVLVLIAGLRDF